jgi:ATP-binding cassette subfamily C protein LapB
MTQNARLFYGTLRENITLGCHAPPTKRSSPCWRCAARQALCRSCQRAGLPDHGKRRGLSGGQRQSILLARMLLRDPNIVLMDEPTASLDEHTEREFIQRLGAGWATARWLSPPTACRCWSWWSAWWC